MKRSKFQIGALGALLLMLIGLSLYLTGLFAVERHQGFYGPIWDADGGQVYYVERDTTGLIIGPGWEMLTPPAQTYVFEDHLRLRRIDLTSGAVVTLEEWRTTPVVGRFTPHYRSRIFNDLAVEIRQGKDAIEYGFQMNIPVVPSSEVNGMEGRWPRAGTGQAEWQHGLDVRAGYSDDALRGGKELIAVPGPEGYASAIVSVHADGSLDVLVAAPSFFKQYKEGIPDRIVAERSWRDPITRRSELEGVRQRILKEYEDQGLSAVEASLRTTDRMEELGYYPKTPRLVATVIGSVPPGQPVFPITDDEFRFGMFSDIEKAIRAPGSQAKKSMGQYVVHRDYTTSAQLNAWLDAGNDWFIVENSGELYRLQIKRD